MRRKRAIILASILGFASTIFAAVGAGIWFESWEQLPTQYCLAIGAGCGPTAAAVLVAFVFYVSRRTDQILLASLILFVNAVFLFRIWIEMVAQMSC